MLALASAPTGAATSIGVLPARDGGSYQHAAGITLLSAAAIMLLAIVPALTDLGR